MVAKVGVKVKVEEGVASEAGEVAIRVLKEERKVIEALMEVSSVQSGLAVLAQVHLDKLAGETVWIKVVGKTVTVRKGKIPLAENLGAPKAMEVYLTKVDYVVVEIH